MKKKIIKRCILCIPIFIVAAFLVVWGVSLLKCEILSNKYGEELFDAYKGKGVGDFEYWLDGYSEAKVISYDSDAGEAQVYYVIEEGDWRGGMLASYMKGKDGWNPVGYVHTLWANKGNADRSVWPYWHHAIWR